ncbi:hypothetical protein [Yinghuangia sp. YIM S09857]|uniref:hypothetical protein n=1 Tax=Yinghuangia sp. YIM S09857 TaxID=3436929 RepID=UPI003F537720
MNSEAKTILLFHNTMRITDGHLDAFRKAIADAVDFAERHGPQLMVEVFIDEPEMTAHSFQMFGDSEAVRAHWRLADPYIQGVMEHCRVESFEVYGRPDDDVTEGIRRGVGDGVVTFAPQVAGFLRFGAAPKD